MGSEFDAVPEHVPDWNRHLRLARKSVIWEHGTMGVLLRDVRGVANASIA